MTRRITAEFHIASDEIGKIELLEILANAGWSYFKCDQVRFLPLGDEDLCNWEIKKISKTELSELIRAKEKSKEVMGISIYWQDTDIGGNILFNREEDIYFHFILSEKRKELKDCDNVTDMNWYIERIIWPFIENDISIGAIMWKETS